MTQKPLSTNSPYLLAVWDEILCSNDVTAVCKSYPLVKLAEDTPHSQRRHVNHTSAKAVKVDVVSNNGERWTRLNTCVCVMLKIRQLERFLMIGTQRTLSLP